MNVDEFHEFVEAAIARLTIKNNDVAGWRVTQTRLLGTLFSPQYEKRYCTLASKEVPYLSTYQVSRCCTLARKEVLFHGMERGTVPWHVKR